MSKLIENIKTGEERAFYNSKDTTFINVTIEGPEDGESAFKECRNINVVNSSMVLRYPFWHCHDFTIKDSTFAVTSRASLWYCTNGKITNTNLVSVKAIRECNNMEISDSTFESEEFGWKSNNLTIKNLKLTGMIAFMDSNNLTIDNLTLKGKYSFQYDNNIKMTNSHLDTKDAFWHSKDVYIKDSILKGEYIAWYSENLTFENCHIDGIQPLCYCKNLKLINCTMSNCNLAFEYSDVQADVKSHISSIKNILKGKVIVDGYDEYINDCQVYPCEGVVEIRKKDEKVDETK